MIRIENLKKSFGKTPVLDGLSVAFEKGQTVSLLGANGSGKSTFIKCLLGLVRPDSGQIFFENQAVLPTSFAYRAAIGYMPQIGRYPENRTVRQVFELLKDLRGQKNGLDEELLETLGIQLFFDKNMGELSGGMRQKVSAALAFLFDPAVLILDEPTAGLDPLSSEILKEKIQREGRRGKFILITSHILDDLDELVTDALYLQDGRLVFYEKMAALRASSGEQKLGKIIAQKMRGEQRPAFFDKSEAEAVADRDTPPFEKKVDEPFVFEAPDEWPDEARDTEFLK